MTARWFTPSQARTVGLALLGLACLFPMLRAEESAAPKQEPVGRIAGQVESKWLKKYPLLVYVDRWDDRVFPVPAEKPLMDQKGKVYIPRLLPVLKGSTVQFRNSDPFVHNTFSPDHEKYDLGDWGQGEIREHTYAKAGVYTQLCRLHPEMVAYVAVLETPYWAVLEAGGNGAFHIDGVPAGAHKLKLWCERFKKPQMEMAHAVEVQAGQTAQVTLKP